MSITRSYLTPNEIVEWTDELTETPNQYGYLNASGLFTQKGVSQTSIAFDRTEHSITLPPRANRGDRRPSTTGRKTTTTFYLGLDFYKHFDQVIGQDVQDKRMPGTQEAETVARVLAEKVELGKAKFDQMKEYMKVQAIKGLVVDSHGNTLTSMFTEFGLAQQTVDFELDDATTDVDGKIRQLISLIAKNAKTGTKVGSTMVMVDPTFYDKLVSHQKVRDAYIQYTNMGKQVMREELQLLSDWGAQNYFDHKGLLFVSYDATFDLENATTGAVTTARAFADDEGYTIVRGVKDAYVHYYGPNDHIDGANKAGAELYGWQYTDPKGQNIELEFQAAPLICLRKPQFSVKVVA